ncbi:MAG: Uncharacterised protein [Gammaproteobacteria bacterium]|nr:MAG: Uncharacterised protein [Gammaproteobacteria bacterium]
MKGISIASTVVPAMSEIIILSSFNKLLTNVDFPAFGLPTMDILLNIFFCSINLEDLIIISLFLNSSNPILFLADIINTSLIPNL